MNRRIGRNGFSMDHAVNLLFQRNVLSLGLSERGAFADCG
ncbi:hypothetical protein Z945_3829 [Sulfitobacter noctilucae]|nr:hypothetical protein Z945_3829 [Sulfitobacter noctilucae]